MSAAGWSERFVAVAENRAALVAVHSLADRVLQGAGEPSLLYLHGAPGTGKTHLVELLRELLAGSSVQVISAREGFETARAPDAAEAAEVDLLIVEDVQFLPTRAHERLVQVLDRRESLGLATLVTASVGPRHLRFRNEPMSARLASRLARGLVVGLLPLKRESRRLFLETVARRRNLQVPEAILAWLASEVHGTRALESALAQLELLERLHGELPRQNLIMDHLRKQLDAQRPSMERIAGHVAGHFRIAQKELRTRSRRRAVLLPRQVSMYLARQLTPLSSKQIGAFFGGCDHSTVLHACRKVEQALKEDVALSGTVRQLHDELS